MAAAVSPSIGLAAASCARSSAARRGVRRFVRLASRALFFGSSARPVRLPRQQGGACAAALCFRRSLGRGYGASHQEERWPRVGSTGEMMMSPSSSAATAAAADAAIAVASGPADGSCPEPAEACASGSRQPGSSSSSDGSGDRSLEAARGEKTSSWLGRRHLGAVVAVVTVAAAVAASAGPSADVALAEDDCVAELTQSPLGLSFCDIRIGSGDPPQQGMLIKAHYRGRLASNGQIFDSSYSRGRPLVFRVGVGEVIKGWDAGILGTEGVPAMLAGGRRRLIIPPDLGYGERGAGCRGLTPDTCVIPPSSTLIFDVEYVGKA